MRTPNVVDADGHILEPVDLFERYMEERDLLPMAPTFYTDDAGLQQFKLEGKTLPRGILGLGGRNAGRPVSLETQKQRWEEQQPGGFDPHARVKDLDLEGIDTAVLFPTVGLRFCGIEDPRVALATCRAYNDWLADFCKPYPDRLVGVATVPFQHPEGAIAEMRRATEKLGFKAAFIRPNPLQGRNLDHPDYRPFWDAAQEIGCPVAIHEGGLMPTIKTVGADRFTNLVYRHMLGHAMEQQIASMTMILGGVCERYPRLKVVFLEAGGGWMPYWLERMDHHHERLGWLIPDCVLSPREYFLRQCYISVDPDEKTIPMLCEMVGDDNVMWASDYPHFDCTFPGVVEEVREAKVPPATMDKILGKNAVRFYGLA